MTRSPSVRHIFFDLDGTLIDSAPSILSTFRQILEEGHIAPVVPLDERLIGPPLKETLAMITGFKNESEVERLAEAFKRVYDNEGFRASVVYEGVDELLKTLHSEGFSMAVATNKRRVPAVRILKHLGWEEYFGMVLTSDSPEISASGKAAMIGWLIARLQADACATPYVGDKPEDLEAARENRMPFFAAGWGYGEWDDDGFLPVDWLLHSPVELLPLLREQAFGPAGRLGMVP